MSSSDSSGAFITGFLLGGLVGAAAALMMTPESGEKTRNRLQQKSVELKTKFDDLSGGLQERGRVVIEETAPISAEPSDKDAAETPIGAEDEGSTEEPTA